ncbi:protein DYAD-like, partial [Trifolium medium]|nr:protein DYAD-like [Trifolium medium]
MDKWGVNHQQAFIGWRGKSRRNFSAVTNEQEESDNDEEKEQEVTIKNEPIFFPDIRKRKRLSLSQLREGKEESSGTLSQLSEVKVESCEKFIQLREVKEEYCGKESSSKNKRTKPVAKDRWSGERYQLAEQTMWEVLKAEGATFENPITRPALRAAARKFIGDTGLLDHLLKHISGKVAPGGTDRFRRWHNTTGVMEYWLESADLDDIRQEAGVRDRYWVPPSTDRAIRASSQDTDSSGELELLKKEMAQMKKDMQELIAKKEKKIESNVMEEICKEFGKWKAITDHRLTEIMASVKNLQGNYGELMNWKTEVEKHLMDITEKLNDLQAARECTTFSPPSDKWKEWLAGPNPNNFQEDALATWIGSSELLNVPQECLPEYPCAGMPTQPLNEEPTNKK